MIPARPAITPIQTHRLRYTTWHQQRANYYRVHTTLRPRAYDYRPAEQPARRGWWLWVYQTLDQRARARWVAYQAAPWLHDPWLSQALCVHRLEGSFTAATGNGFYGGFQYLESTWIASGGLTYAPRADQATPQEQLHVTYNVTSRYGWGQWPTTARVCGLL